MLKVHIHEDDEGMRNVYPADTVNDVMDDIAAAKVSSVENLAPNGIGWTDVHAIREPQTIPGVGPLTAMAIEAFAQHLSRCFFAWSTEPRAPLCDFAMPRWQRLIPSSILMRLRVAEAGC